MRTTGNPTIDTALETLLASGQYVMADLYTFTFPNGTSQYITSLDVPITWNPATQTTSGGNVYSSTGLLLTRDKLTWERGITVDQLKITIAPRTAQIGSVNWLAGAINGGLDGAWCQLDRLFCGTSYSGMNLAITPVASLCLFYGPVTDVDPVGRSSLAITVKDVLDFLSQKWPFNLIIPNCGWQLYSPGCTLAKSAWTVSGVVSPGATVTSIPTNLSQASNYFNLGVITFTSGVLSGSFATVATYASGVITPVVPVKQAPASGDTFSIYPGCDHTLGSGGCAKFSNQANWRGFPYVPVPETAT